MVLLLSFYLWQSQFSYWFFWNSILFFGIIFLISKNCALLHSNTCFTALRISIFIIQTFMFVSYIYSPTWRVIFGGFVCLFIFHSGAFPLYCYFSLIVLWKILIICSLYKVLDRMVYFSIMYFHITSKYSVFLAINSDSDRILGFCKRMG